MSGAVKVKSDWVHKTIAAGMIGGALLMSGGALNKVFNDYSDNPEPKKTLFSVEMMDTTASVKMYETTALLGAIGIPIFIGSMAAAAIHARKTGVPVEPDNNQKPGGPKI